VLATGLEQPAALTRVRQAAAEGLTLFGVADADGPPDADPRFYTAEEVRRIDEACCELLLLDAEALAQPRVGEQAAAWARPAAAGAGAGGPGRPAAAGRPTPTPDWCAGPSGWRRWARPTRHARPGGGRRGRTPSWPPTTSSSPWPHYKLGDIKESLRTLGNALQRQPGHYGALYLKGAAFIQGGNWQEAKVALSACLKQRPGLPPGRCCCAPSRPWNWGNPTRRGADLDAVLEHSPDADMAYVALVNRGALAVRLRRWPEAVDHLTRAVRARPEAYAAHVNLALAHRQRAESAAWQAPALLLAPRGAFALLAAEAYRRQALGEAVAVLDEAVRLRPDGSRLYHERGRLFLLLAEPARARDDFTRAVATAVNAGAGSTLAADLVEVGRLLHGEGRHDEAVRSYELALRVRPRPAGRVPAEGRGAAGAAADTARPAAAVDEFLRTVPLAEPGRVPALEEARQLAEALKVRGVLVRASGRRAGRDRQLHAGACGCDATPSC